MHRLNKKGFTIIELLIATISFSLVLLILTAAIIQFNRLYYKSTINTKTQETTRAVLEDIARNIQFSGSDVVPGNTSPRCAGNYRYTFTLNQRVSGATHALQRDTSSCPGGSPSADQTELLGTNMQLLNLNISSSGANTYTITAEVAYGNDLVGGKCPTIRLGGQFCSVSKLSTTVTKRL